VVSKTSSAHSITVPWSPLDPIRSVRITGSPTQAPPPLSLRGNLSAFAVVLVSETPNQPTRQMGCLVTASTPTQTYSGWPPHFTTDSSTAMNEYSCGFGLKLSFSSENLPHPLPNTRLRDWLALRVDQRSQMFSSLRLNPKAFRSIAITLSSREPLLAPHENI